MKKKLLLWLIVCLCLMMGWSLYSSKYLLEVSEYTIESDVINKPIRIVHLTDLHNSEFGKENVKLVSLIQKQQPDIILITGDLVNSNNPKYDIALNLVSKLTAIAPVYISWGNHEAAFEKKYGIDLEDLFKNAGANVMEYEYEDITVNEQKIRLGGIFGYCLPAKYLKTYEANEAECGFLAEFQNTELFTILMCHMPVCWILNHGLDEWDVNCVVSGHVHGGQIILPFIGGLYAPDFGRFPGKLDGLFLSSDKDKTMVLSRGLGTVENIPRFNNVPEIVVVNLE